MAGVKISELPAATTLTGTELVPVVQSSATVATTPAAIKTYTNSAIPNSALSQINTSTTDTTVGNISRNGDWGVGSTAVNIASFEDTSANYSRFGRALPGAVGGSGAAMSVIAIPYDGTPVTNYLGITGSTTGNAKLWAGTKSGSSPGTIGWTEFARLNSPTFTSNLGLGGISSTYLLSVAGSLTGGVTTGGVNISSTIQSDVTTTAYGALIGPTTAASAFTLGTYTGVQVGLTLGAGSTVTNAFGFRATSLLGTTATNSYGFSSEIASGTNKFNIYASGTAQNYLNGPLGLGALTLTGHTFRNLLSITGATTAHQNQSGGVIQSDVTATALYNETNANTVAASFTLASLIHYRANQGTFGASSTVTAQSGFLAASSLIGAGSNYGFRGQIAAASGRWNIYMDGTADNFIAGNVGIGSNSFSGYTLRVNKALDNNSHKGIASEGQVTNGGAAVDYFYTNSSQATAVSTTLLSHYRATQGTYTSAPTSQAGFNADSTLTGAGTNNYGFRGQIPSSTGRWNLYMDGTADNYILGNVGIGSGKTVPAFALDVNGTINGTYHAGSTATGLTAATPTALTLAAAFNVVSTTPTSGAVTLPNVLGTRIWILNSGANTLTVNPSSGTINGSATHTLATTTKMQYVQVSTGVWYTIS